MNREDYKKIYSDLNLTEAQKSLILNALEDLMATNAKKIVSLGGWHDGKVEGLNTAYRFIAGTLEDHDEFDS